MKTIVLRHAEANGNTMRCCEFNLFRTESTLSVSEHKTDNEKPKKDAMLLADVFITHHVHNDPLATSITAYTVLP
jgi:hypothetical protein